MAPHSTWTLALALFTTILSGGEARAQAPTGSLESVTPTPFVIGGVKLDLDRIQIAPTPVPQGGSVLSGTATHTQTARLIEPMTVRAPLINQRIEPGVIVHRVEFARQTPEGSRANSVWCGDFGMKTIIGARAPVMCMSTEDGSFRAFQMGSAQAWLSTASTSHGSAPIRFDKFIIEPSELDLLGEMGINLEFLRMRRDKVTLRLTARMEDRSVHVLDVERPVVNGVADFPFWTHRLRLAVIGETVQPELSREGDGVGLSEIGVYLTQ